MKQSYTHTGLATDRPHTRVTLSSPAYPAGYSPKTPSLASYTSTSTWQSPKHQPRGAHSKPTQHPRGSSRQRRSQQRGLDRGSPRSLAQRSYTGYRALYKCSHGPWPSIVCGRGRETIRLYFVNHEDIPAYLPDVFFCPIAQSEWNRRACVICPEKEQAVSLHDLIWTFTSKTLENEDFDRLLVLVKHSLLHQETFPVADKTGLQCDFGR